MHYRLPPNLCLLTHFGFQDKDLTVLPVQETSSTVENKFREYSRQTAPHSLSQSCLMRTCKTTLEACSLLCSNAIAQLRIINNSKKKGNMKALTKRKLLCGKEGKKEHPNPLPVVPSSLCSLPSLPISAGFTALQNLQHAHSQEATLSRSSLLKTLLHVNNRLLLP